MKISVKKSEIKGVVNVPSSKSMTIRALMCAALSRGASEIVHPLVSEDTNAAAEVLGKIGVRVQKENDLWKVTGGSLRSPAGELYCGESATTMRFMIAICSLIPGIHTLVGGPSLTKRPVKSLVEALRKLGVKCELGGKTTPPVTIEGGSLKGSQTEIPGNISSQFISALLLIAPFGQKGMSIKLTTPMTSTPYVLMTIWCLKKFGINVKHELGQFIIPRQRYVPARVEVEGDWSSASYFLALGAVSEAGVTVENLSTSTLQGDRILLDHLRRMGASVRFEGNRVTVSQSKLKKINADLSDSIDLLPTMAVLAALADGKSELIGIERARIKESNRVTAVKEGLQKLGISVTEERDRLTIIGLRTPVKIVESTSYEDAPKAAVDTMDALKKGPVLINSYGDHRIAMAFSVLGASEGNIIVDGAECVAKTYPGFWEVFKSVGGEMEENVQ
jgi:3-phosphoshikimate 1-carboxyvinyltransferase